MKRFATIVCLTLPLILVSSASPAKDKLDGKRGKAQRNLPEIDSTASSQFDLENEVNLFAHALLNNLSLNYGLTPDWDVGISFLNAQFASLNASAIQFQPDLLLNLEKHWQTANRRWILGSQSGVGLAQPGTRFMSLAYLEYQRHLPRWNIDIDSGGYYANAALAGIDSVGLHLNLEFPLWKNLRFNADYLSGRNNLGGASFKLLQPVNRDWRIGIGVQIPNLDLGNSVILGLYWH